jgi:hypothetical protein
MPRYGGRLAFVALTPAELIEIPVDAVEVASDPEAKILPPGEYPEAVNVPPL